MNSEKTSRNVTNKKNKTSSPTWVRREQHGKISAIPEKISNIILIPKQKDRSEIQNINGADIKEEEDIGILIKEIIRIIDIAEEFICISSFVIGNRRIQDALLRAYERKVRIYFLTASENYLERDILSERDIEAIEKHIHFLKEMQGKALIRSSRDYHLKCILIDPKNQKNKKGYLMTCNLTGAVYKSPDIAVKLNKSQIDVVFHQFLIGFYYLASGEIRKDGIGDLPESIKKLPIELPVIKSPKAEIYPTIKCQNGDKNKEYETLWLKKKLMEFIQESDGELKVFAWNFDDRSDPVKEIILQLKSGRRVKTLTNQKTKNGKVKPGLNKLLNEGAEIYGIPYFHAKGVISKKDGKYKAFIMTSNFENPGIEFGFNVGIMINDESQALKLNQLFDEWCRCSEFELKKK